MPGKLSDSLAPGTLIEVVYSSQSQPTRTLLILCVDYVAESFMNDGNIYDLFVIDDEGTLDKYLVHSKEIEGKVWFSSRKLRFY